MKFRIERERLDGFDTSKLIDTETGAFAQVAPELGFNMFRLHLKMGHDLVPVLLEPPSLKDLQANPSRYGNPILFPFPNRIRSGRFAWKDRHFELPVNPSGHAIHGYALRSPWRVVEETADDSFARIIGEWRLSVDAPEHDEHWPGDVALRVTYQLQRGFLTVDAEIQNPGTVEVPWGLGYHTYFRLPWNDEGDASRTRIVVPASRKWELEGFLPTGRKVPVPAELDFRNGLPRAGLKADDVLTGLDHGADGSIECRLVDPPSGREVFMEFSREFSELVVFTPSWNDRAIALEPYTQTTDAINLAARGIDGGLRVAAPNSRTSLSMKIGTRPDSGK